MEFSGAGVDLAQFAMEPTCLCIEAAGVIELGVLGWGRNDETILERWSPDRNLAVDFLRTKTKNSK